MTKYSQKYLILIAGPTAVGKSSLSLELAKMYRCPILSADSRQIYKDLNIGTDKVSPAIREQIPHYFIDKLRLGQEFNAGMFEQQALAILNELFIHHPVLIMAGGTGLYLKAIMSGLDQFPDVEASTRQKWQSLYEDHGIEILQSELKEKDPLYYKMVDLNNPHRLIRALSVMEKGERPYSSYLNDHQAERNFKMVPILLIEDRDKLYAKINKRVDHMIQKGLLNEVQSLYPYRHLKSLQTVGYRELFEYLDGKISLDEAVEKIKINTRRYAKRQMTWFRKYGSWNKFDPADRDQILSFIRSKIQAESLEQE